MSKKTFITAAIIVAILAFIGYTLVVVLQKKPTVLQGEVEATQFKVSSKLAGRVQEIAVKKGQKVNKGDLIFSIESPEVNAKMDEAVAARSAASAQNRKAINGAQEEDIAAAYSLYVKAEAAAQFAEKSFERIQNLFESGVVPAQQRDEVETKMKAARETANAAKAQWQKAEKGAREEDKATAAAMVQRADAAIKQVQAYLDETTIYSGADGEVSGINVEAGELVNTGFPVVTLINLDDVWVTLFVREDLLNDFKMGSTFKAKIPGLDNREFDFQVTYVSAAGEFARWNATKTSGEFDLKSFEIEARPVSKIEGLRPGMSVVITLN
ncbi:MAG: HlyD family secretion protein [Draconibacterium sp.]